MTQGEHDLDYDEIDELDEISGDYQYVIRRGNQRGEQPAPSCTSLSLLQTSESCKVRAYKF